MDIDIRTLLNRLNPVCKLAMEQAAQLCVRHTHYNVDIEHLLLQLLEMDAPDLKAILERFDIRAADLTAQLQNAVDLFKRGNGRTPALSPNFSPLFQEAWLLSSMLLGEQQIRSGTLVLALLEVDSLRGMLMDSAPALLKIARGALRDGLSDILAGSSEGNVAAGAGTGVSSGTGAGMARAPGS